MTDILYHLDKVNMIVFPPAQCSRGSDKGQVLDTDLLIEERASPRLVAYSFRHTIKEALRSAGVLNHLQDRIMGHSGEGRISAGYGAGRSQLSETRKALVAAMEFLGDVDPTIYSERERMK